MKKIQDKNRGYFALKCYVDCLFKSAYRRVEYHGKENIPQDGAIIYAPNHTNTLMDALAVLAIDKQVKVFVARADVFKQPTILKILTFLKMLPINRIRDGRESLAKNEEINDIVVDVLRDKVPFCILPEGKHRTKHSLMPLQKGLFRIALQANDTFGSEMPVYIVPVGIEFGHFFRYRSSLLLQIGEPINVSQFIKEHPELNLPQQQINALREDLSDRMKKMILHIPDDENYDATFELAQLSANEQQKRLGLRKKSLQNRFTATKESIKNIVATLQSKPAEMQELLDEAGEFSRQRDTLGIGIKSVLNSHIAWSIIGKKILFLLGLPYFIFSAIVTSPINLLFAWLGSKFEDKAFLNTVRYLAAFILLPILFLLLGIIVVFVFSWLWGLVFALLFLPAYFFYYDYIALTRSLLSDTKWLIHKELHKQLKKIKDLKTNLLD